jgi:hypothetical protein
MITYYDLTRCNNNMTDERDGDDPTYVLGKYIITYYVLSVVGLKILKRQLNTLDEPDQRLLCRVRRCGGRKSQGV